MLQALDIGVKGGKWYSLIDKMVRPGALGAAWRQVRANQGAPGTDHVSIEAFERRAEEELQKLREELREGRYQPQAIRRVYIPKPGSSEQRPLGIPTVRDRVVQAALRIGIEPIFEIGFNPNSYGFRPGRGAKDALAAVMSHLRKGEVWVIDADLKAYFDSIPHNHLLVLVEEKIADARILELIAGFLRAGVIEGGQEIAAEGSRQEGTPQGGVISPLLANLYLNDLDHEMTARNVGMVRHADDFVVLCTNETEARQALAAIQEWTQRRGLTLHPEKTKIVNMDEPRATFDFLGFRFMQKQNKKDDRPTRTFYRFVRPKSEQKLKDAIRGITRRTNAHSLQVIVVKVNQRLQGWSGYFRTAHESVHRHLDKWMRMRLRSNLRKRSKRKGRGRGYDHNRWPNAFFDQMGLFSLLNAHQAYMQSPRG
ncbi:MAG: group II intron reverse transcriptase/maturase [Acidobacteria bacterium]|nr:group II intron reverse transcriptase/maturase [Acidobacteriota bacterium]